MNFILTLAYLFFVGSISGWVLELFFRKWFSSSNPEHKWINPGFCTGPYLPIYGFGLCALYLLALLGRETGLDGSIQGRVLLFLGMAVSMTLIEYIGGLLLLKGAKIRLWDYSNCRGNIQGLICPLFSFFWALLSAGYYFLIHPHILTALAWLSENLAFSFVIGFFFGVFRQPDGHVIAATFIGHVFPFPIVGDESRLTLQRSSNIYFYSVARCGYELTGGHHCTRQQPCCRYSRYHGPVFRLLMMQEQKIKRSDEQHHQGEVEDYRFQPDIKNRQDGNMQKRCNKNDTERNCQNR
jgi:hypothetical protein